MASPFSGMDPYLEGDLWQEFHETLAGAIRAQLVPQLPPKYAALLAKRYVVDRPALGIFAPPSERILYPDVHVVAERAPVYQTAPGVTAATLELSSPMLDQTPVLSVEIRDVAERRLVTLIEILSPVNKRGQGAQEYLDRRIELMQTATHLLEIDLLTAGYRIPLAGDLPPAPYYVYLSRHERRPRTEIWAIRLQDALPRLPVPLLHPDPDVVLDLQAAVDACFALVGYERLLDYRADPPGALSAADRQWVKERLAAWAGS
ncbi:MAG: DUF4058 family protein [Caldilinea sp.]